MNLIQYIAITVRVAPVSVYVRDVEKAFKAGADLPDAIGQVIKQHSPRAADRLRDFFSAVRSAATTAGADEVAAEADLAVDHIAELTCEKAAEFTKAAD